MYIQPCKCVWFHSTFFRLRNAAPKINQFLRLVSKTLRCNYDETAPRYLIKMTQFIVLALMDPLRGSVFGKHTIYLALIHPLRGLVSERRDGYINMNIYNGMKPRSGDCKIRWIQ